MEVGANDGRRWRGRIGWILTVCLVLGIAAFLLTPFIEQDCTSLLTQSEAPMMLPPGCKVTVGAHAERGLENFDAERRTRGLEHESWIECASAADGQAWLGGLEANRRWLPSYVPGTYQWRRTVIVVSHASSNFPETHVIAEVCFMPRWRYIQQIRGQCDGKFAVWK
jgi:hypothetical protein